VGRRKRRRRVILGTLIGGPKHGDTEDAIIQSISRGLPAPEVFTYTNERTGDKTTYRRHSVPSLHAAGEHFSQFYLWDAVNLPEGLSLLAQAYQTHKDRHPNG
jgi:hypothetical protein